jgi:hypothetical protein
MHGRDGGGSCEEAWGDASTLTPQGSVEAKPLLLRLRPLTRPVRKLYVSQL